MRLVIISFILLISFNIYTKEISILVDIPGEGVEIINHTKVKVHYIGKLTDGKEFDNSYKRGEPIKFQIGTRQVIQGWEIGLLGMKIGGKRTILIPPDMAYGNNGVKDLIPPNSSLIFDIEIVDAVLPGYRIINSDQVKLALTGNYIIIDIRTQKERNSTGIIPGSIELTAFDEFGNFIPSFLNYFNKNTNQNDKIIFVSNKGEISEILANGFVESLQYKNIYSVKGGIQSLIDNDFQLVKN